MDREGTIGARLAVLFVALIAGGPVCLVGWWLWPSGVADLPFASLTLWLLVQILGSLAVWAIGLWLFFVLASAVLD